MRESSGMAPLLRARGHRRFCLCEARKLPVARPQKITKEPLTARSSNKLVDTPRAQCGTSSVDEQSSFGCSYKLVVRRGATASEQSSVTR